MTETPAETIRRAAKLMRERAEYCTEGPWGTGRTQRRSSSVAGRSDQLIATCKYRPDAAHIASWHPLVAAAVADWLESEGHRAGGGDGGIEEVPAAPYRVACAYLGEAP